ncbi:hypothetical protein, partial [Rhodoplanes sp. SY1]|uniref:hypothetical protein n=1 Tax=Rhodoplanes sp. SY1 TaxID=3166646 RepID=UPI0038B67021
QGDLEEIAKSVDAASGDMKSAVDAARDLSKAANDTAELASTTRASAGKLQEMPAELEIAIKGFIGNVRQFGANTLGEAAPVVDCELF